MQFYSDPSREDDDTSLPDAEVFYHDDDEPIGDEPMPSGWYWWPCFPGCLPDGDPIGPFATRAEAIADAREDLTD